MTSKTVMIMAGGTGGHVFPALAVADELKQQGYQIHWLGTAIGIEADVIPKAGYPLHCIEVTGLRGKGKLALLAAPIKILKAIFQALKIIRAVRPDAVLGLGGFATGPGGIAAKILGVPLLIHEQNAFPGMTNRLLKPFANVVMQAFSGTFDKKFNEGSAEKSPNTSSSVDINRKSLLKRAEKILTTGNPVRADILKLNESREVSLKEDHEALNILVVGGSLGAVGLNNAVMEALALILQNTQEKEQVPNIWHQVGKKNIDAVNKQYAEKGLAGRANVVPFIDDMAEAYAWADLVVCRSGALTVSEIACAGKAAIFIPFPFAVDDHQTANAQILVNSGAAEIKQQSELSAEWLVERWTTYARKPQLLKNMAIAARAASIADATQVVSEQVIQQIRLND